MRLLGASLLALALATLLIVVSCGGKLTLGYDDAGNYHTSDGALLVQGAGCVGWDASRIVDGNPSCELDADDCQSIMTPPGFHSVDQCLVVGDASTCGTIDFRYDVPCDTKHWGKDAADQFCSAYWDQFITHGHVHGECTALCDPSVPTNELCCHWEVIKDTCFTLDRLPVFYDDGSVGCVAPCAP